MSADYRRKNGKPTTADDPERLLWYGICTYWTDDWSKLDTRGFNAIPTCPTCKRPGFQAKAGHWFEDVAKWDEDNPGYAKFLNQCKEQCHGKENFMDLFAKWQKQQEAQP